MKSGSDSVSVVIPCFNERDSIETVVARVREADLGMPLGEIIVVDDGSTDGTRDVLRELNGVKAIFHERNSGKGAALRTGFAAASSRFVVIQDADLEYSPQDLKMILAPLAEGRADAVIGSRFAYERPRFFFGERKSPFFTHYLGNNLIVMLTNLLYGAAFTDYEGAYKAFLRADVLSLEVSAAGFEFDNEVLCRLLRRGKRVVEVPIRYAPRSYQDGKKITWRDGATIVWTIIKWRVLPA